MFIRVSYSISSYHESTLTYDRCIYEEDKEEEEEEKREKKTRNGKRGPCEHRQM